MVNAKKLGIGGGGMFVFGILFGWMGFPAILRSQIKKQIALKDGAEIRDLWSNLPIPLDFKIHIFNITNPTEIEQGQKPIVEDIGPFFYDEYKQKVNLIDREEDDSVEYNIKNTFFFNPAKSHGLTGEEEVVVPHVLILGIVQAMMRDRPAAIGIVGKAVDSIFKKPPSLFIRIKAKQILFEGLPIDCTVTDFAGSAVCSALKEQADDLVEEEPNHYLFSLFGAKNGTVIRERIRVLRGIKNYKDVGRVIEVDGKPTLSIWPEDHCNELQGTDSTIFPPLMTEDDDIISFSPEICRSMGAHYSHKTKVKGLNTLHYTAGLGDSSANPEEKCFCTAPDNCLTKNLFDLTKCLGVPIIGSLPHFLDSEEKYRQMVDGLHPDPAEHDISMDFEPMTATPIKAHKRMQFNMFIQPIPKLKLMKNFPDALLPLFWVEEGILLDDSLVKKVKLVFTAMAVVGFLKWVMVLGGLGMAGASAYLHFKNHGNSDKLEITKVSPQSNSGKNSGQEKKWPPALNVSTIQSAAVPPNLDRS